MFFAFNRNPRHYLKNGVTDPKLKWFTDLNFMRALAHSIDKKSMIDLSYYGLAESAVAEISPANKIFHNPNLKDYEFDPRLAAELLEKAGYRLAKSGQRVDAQGNRIEFNLTTTTGKPEREQLCAIFTQDLEDLGIKVNYRPLEFTTLVEKLDSTFSWDVVLMGFTGTIEPNNGSNVLRSSGNLHLWDPRQLKPATAWEAEIDRLLDQGTAEMDPSKRAKFYWRIQEILHEQLPLLETVRQIRYTAYKNSLENYEPTVWGTYRQELMQFRAE
jgi:peptide/nickel transport system substrate-binding protein